MSQVSEPSVLQLLDEAKRQVARVRELNWVRVSGKPAASNLDELDRQLNATLLRVRSGEEIRSNDFSGAVRWVTDWIPDISDPLVAAIGAVEAYAAGREKASRTA